jgi:hypothetical protein
MAPRPFLAIFLGLAFLGLAVQAGRAEGGLDPLYLGSLGFRSVDGSPSLEVLEGRDSSGAILRLSPSPSTPHVIYCFDARYPGAARAALAGLEAIRLARRGSLGVAALTTSFPAQLSRTVAGLDLGFPVASITSLPAALAQGNLPAWILLAPGARLAAIRYGDFDWAGGDGGHLLAAILEAWPPRGPNPSAFLDDEEQALLEELNLARAAPRAYIEFVRDYEFRIRASRLEYPGEEAVALMEGLSAAEEAIAFLEAQRPLAALEAQEDLGAAAKAWFETGASPSSLFTLLESRGQWKGTAGASILKGPGKARRLVVGLIVDDGQPGRPDRAAIFNGDFRRLGIYLGPGAGLGDRGALVYAWGFSGLH